MRVELVFCAGAKKMGWGNPSVMAFLDSSKGCCLLGTLHAPGSSMPLLVGCG